MIKTIEYKNTKFIYDDNMWNEKSSKDKEHLEALLMVILSFVFIAFVFGIAEFLDYAINNWNLNKTFTIISFSVVGIVFMGMFLFGGIFCIIGMIYRDDLNIYEALDWAKSINDLETLYANGRVLFIQKSNENITFGVKGLCKRLRIDELKLVEPKEIGNNIIAEIDLTKYPEVLLNVLNE